MGSCGFETEFSHSLLFLFKSIKIILLRQLSNLLYAVLQNVAFQSADKNLFIPTFKSEKIGEIRNVFDLAPFFI